jgi:hypothetical protein
MSAFGGTAAPGASSASHANKIRHFLDCLLPRKWRWEAHGKHGARGLWMWKSSKLVRASEPIWGFAVGQRQRSTTSSLIDCTKHRRVSPEDYGALLAELDARLAADTRDATAGYFGDPEPSRSALHRRRDVAHRPPRSHHAGTRTDLWKR